MPNLASVLKDEIVRLARKEIKAQVGVTKRAAAQHRRDIAGLKRQVQALAKRVAYLESKEIKRVSEPGPAASTEGMRFSPRWVKAHRKRIGLNAADYGKLMGVSALTIYSWEGGKSKPRKDALARFASVRELGKREARKRLEMLNS